MNISTSNQYSSGCESGWTTYLDQLSYSNDDPYKRVSHKITACDDHHQEEYEDLSMVSDASSGPSPYYHDYGQNYEAPGNYNYHYDNYGNVPSVSEDQKKMKKNKTKEEKSRAKREKNLGLDDTASSSIFQYSQDNVAPCDAHDNYSVDQHEYGSHVFSSANFEGESKSKAKKHFGFLKSSTKGKSGSFLGRKRQ